MYFEYQYNLIGIIISVLARASPKDDIWPLQWKCTVKRSIDVVGMIMLWLYTGESLVKPRERWFEERRHTSWHSSSGWKKLSGKQSGQWDWLQPRFRTSWLESRIRASPLVSTCRMLLKCSKSSHYLLHFLAEWLSLQVSQLLCLIAWHVLLLEKKELREKSESSRNTDITSSSTLQMITIRMNFLARATWILLHSNTTTKKPVFIRKPLNNWTYRT